MFFLFSFAETSGGGEDGEGEIDGERKVFEFEREREKEKKGVATRIAKKKNFTFADDDEEDDSPDDCGMATATTVRSLIAAEPRERVESCFAGNRVAESGKAVNAPDEDGGVGERLRPAALAAAEGTARAAPRGRAAPATKTLLLLRAGQQVPRRAIDIEKVFIGVS